MLRFKVNLVLLIVIGLFGLMQIGVPSAMSIIDMKLPLNETWKARFSDIKKFNDYARSNPVEINNTTIENQNVDTLVINSGKFEKTDWNNVSAKNTSIKNVVFRQGIIEDVDFSGSALTNVIFEDVKLRGVAFFNGTLTNVRFVRCTFNGVGIEQTKNSSIEVIDSKAISSSFSRGQLVAVFRNSKLSEEVRLTSLQPPSALKFEKSEIEDLDMDRSVLQTLVIDESKFDGGLQVGGIDKLVIRNSVVDATFSATGIKSLSGEQCDISRMEFIEAKIDSMSFSGCKRLNNFNIYKTNIGVMSISNSALSEFSPVQARIGKINLKNSSIVNSEFMRMKAESIIFDNVTLGGELDFTGAQVGELKTKDVTKQYDLKLITTGSNVRF